MIINYCGVRPYETEAYKMALRLERKYPGMFRFEVNRDFEFTDRLECKILFNTRKHNKRMEAIVHSKKSGMGHPSDNWTQFLDRAAEAVYNYRLQKSGDPSEFYHL